MLSFPRGRARPAQLGSRARPVAAQFRGLVAEREIGALADRGGHAGLVDLPMPDGRMARHWEVCGKKLPFTASIKSAREVVRKLVSDHGQRALQAERDDGIDWKALSHAVRVGREAVELFETGRIVFPLSCAPELRAIRGGGLKYADVAAAIERLAGDVETAARSSTLREKPDQNFIDDLVARAHRGKVMESA